MWWLFSLLFGQKEVAPQPPTMGISDAAFKLITDAEGIDQPYLFPGGDSGISVGYGDDLGYQTLAQFETKWKDQLSEADFNLLKSAIGLKGMEAARAAHNYREVHITSTQAMAVFKNFTIPEYEKLTEGAFPGVKNLCPNAYGAMVSLVYNRGAGTAGSSRMEMAKIKSILAEAHSPIPAETYKAIAAQFRSMKRLWLGRNLDGLLTRRENEAKLVESCIS